MARYNEKVKAAMEHMALKNEDILIKEKGRNMGEDAVVLVKNGQYSGYGFIERDVPMHSVEDVTAFIKPQKHTLETQQIVQSYLNKNPQNVFISSDFINSSSV